jgi:superfamily II DNA or RNA helicase
MQWRTRAGDEVAASLGEPLTKDLTAQALRTALDPHGAWIPEVFTAAQRRLKEIRRDLPDAAGLVIASDQTHARAYAELIENQTGVAPTLVLSDEAGSSDRIKEFANGTSEWMVAVRMVSEGVDVPRLSVGVYATTTTTPLFFAQAVGRFVRARRRGETASVFVPSITPLLTLAAELEAERDHVIGRRINDESDIFAASEAEMARANAEESASGDLLGEFAALDSRASFDRVVYDGSEFDASSLDAGLFEYDHVTDDHEELDFLGIPGLLEPDQVADLLRNARVQKRPTRRVAEEDLAHEKRAELRRELNSLVAAWHHRTGTPHGVTHNRLRQAAGGPQAATATAKELQKRIDLLRDWALSASG